MYFVDSLTMRSGFKFTPFTYGPFSFDLAEALDEMSFKGDIVSQNNNYMVSSLENYPSSQEITEKLYEAIDNFSESVGNDFSFKNMEILGTALYCARSLKASGETVTIDSIVNDFKAWKGSKYTDQNVVDVSKHLLRYYTD
jgi:hypothetical protein